MGFFNEYGMMHTQFNGAISSAITDTSDKVISEVQNIIVNLTSRQKDVGTRMFTCNQGLSDWPNRTNINLKKENFRSAFDLREDVDLSPHILAEPTNSY